MGRASQVKKLRHEAKADLQQPAESQVDHINRVIKFIREPQVARILASLQGGARDWIYNFKPKRVYRKIISEVSLKAEGGQLYCTLIPHQ
jgi:hypothetical protein